MKPISEIGFIKERRMERAIVLGSINVDFVSFTRRYPLPGETLMCEDFGIYQGGKGANQAVALARLDVPTTMLGKIGNDISGDIAIASLGKSGVNTEHILKSNSSNTGSTTIWVNNKGKSSILVYPGANGEINEEFVLRYEEHFKEASWFLTQFEIPLEGIIPALRFARRYGLKTVVDPSPATSVFDKEIWKYIDFLLPNAIEIKELTGEEDMLKGIRILKSLGIGEVIVKSDKNGASFEGDGVLLSIPAFEIDQVVDTTGAGDCFIAGFVYGMMQKKGIKEAIRIANLVASYSVQHKGAAVSFPTKDEIDWRRLKEIVL